MEFVLNNLEWFLLGFMIIEKIVRLTPTKKDDVIFDMILKPIWEALSEPKNKEKNDTKQKSKISTKANSTKH